MKSKKGRPFFHPAFFAGLPVLAAIFLIAAGSYDSLSPRPPSRGDILAASTAPTTQRQRTLLKLYRQQHSAVWDAYKIDNGRLPYTEAERTDCHNEAWLNAVRVLGST